MYSRTTGALEKPTIARAKGAGGAVASAVHARVDTAVDTHVIDRAILRLNALCRQATMDFAIAVGKVVVDTLHSGSLESWRAAGSKGPSFRALARHPDLPMSPAALCRSVAIFELSHRLEIARWTRISTSHIRLVLPLGHAEQARLLDLADSHSWSVRRLNEEVAKLPAHEVSSKGGRTRESRLRRTMKVLERCIDDLEGLCTPPQREISAETAASLREAIPRLRELYRKINHLPDKLRKA